MFRNVYAKRQKKKKGIGRVLSNVLGSGLKQRNNAGFTFIEVLYATAILVIAILAMVGANTYIRRANEAMNERTLAVERAEGIIEQLRSLANGPGTFPVNVTRSWPQGSSLLYRPAFEHEQRVTVNYLDPTADPLEVTVRVDWRSLGTRDSSLEVRALLTRRG